MFFHRIPELFCETAPVWITERNCSTALFLYALSENSRFGHPPAVAGWVFRHPVRYCFGTADTQPWPGVP